MEEFEKSFEADWDTYKLIIFNFISNSVKYTRNMGNIKVTLRIENSTQN